MADSISVVIVTFNEERNVGRAIKSVMQVADEIIVLDSFSTDRTKQICAQYGVKFMQKEWQGYVCSKNYANNLATNNWILSLDADEELDAEMAADILNYKKEGFQGVYVLNRLTNYCGTWIRHSSWYPDKKVRIFDKSIAKWTGAFVHEELVFSETVIETLIKGHLNHYSYHSQTEHRSRADKYSVLTAQKMNLMGGKASFLKPFYSSIFRFFSMYFLRAGFLDGRAGFMIALISARSNVLKYKTLRELNKKMTESSPKRIIISRTDSIGDVILTLPLAGILKEKYPDSKIIFLGRSYTESIVRVSVYIDEFINWDELKNDVRAVETLKGYSVDFFIHVFPNKKIAYLALKAKIPNRIGALGRAFHFFSCNKILYFSRKKSNLHESQLNVKLLAPLGIKKNFSLNALETYYGFTRTKKIPIWLSDQISKSRVNVILHPKSKGSAPEWGLKNFYRLINQLPKEEFKIFITGTKEEGKLIEGSLPLDKMNVMSLIGKLSLGELIAFIQSCDCLVAASTGPLHIAAALGKRAIGLFSSRKPIDPGRWAPLGIKSESVVFDRDCVKCKKKENCDCINKIPVERIIRLLRV